MPKAPQVRLAYHPLGNRTLSVRHALTVTGDGGACSGENLSRGLKVGQTINERPALLVSFVYLNQFLKKQHLFSYRDWALDSGAFSAHNSGVTIDLKEYIETAKELLAKDKTLVEVFGLDVIGDHRKTIRNCEAMWEAGIHAIPTYHHGSSVDGLIEIAKTYPKIALGGVALKRLSFKMEFAKQCFARVWPKLIHGFGYGSREAILAMPWHSVDATNWEIGPCRFGRWAHYGQMSVRGSKQDLRVEVKKNLETEAIGRAKWGKVLNEVAGRTNFTSRLAFGMSGRSDKQTG